MMNNKLLLLFVIAILIAGGAAGWMGFITQNQDNWSPRDYVVRDGGCIVDPQGDPLYDSWYAERVNAPNCQALENQEQAHYLQAKAREITIETNQGVIGVYVVLGVLAVTMILIFIAVLRGTNATITKF